MVRGEWNVNSGDENLAGKQLAERYPGFLDVDDQVPVAFGDDGDRSTGYEPQAFQKVPGVVLAVNLVDVANIADIEHGEWHDMVLNQIRRES